MQFKDLPDDVIVDVLATCGIVRILRMRALCRRAFNITTLHAVWCNALTHFCERYPYLSPQLERPTSFYSSSDLELAVTRLYRANRNWTAPAPSPTRCRRWDVPTSDQGCTPLLIPGGRWLLEFHKSPFKVIYYDLDSAEDAPQAHEIIHHNQLLDGLHVVHHKCLPGGNDGFWLFITTRSADDRRHPGRIQVHMWHIASEGRSCSTLRLTTRPVWDLEVPPSTGGLNNWADVDRQIFIQTTRDSIYLYQWTGSTIHSQAMMTFGPDEVRMHMLKKVERKRVDNESQYLSRSAQMDPRLLPNDQIAVVSWEWLEIFHLPQFTPYDVGGRFARSPPSNPIRRIALPGGLDRRHSRILEEVPFAFGQPYVPIWHATRLLIVTPTTGEIQYLPCIERDEDAVFHRGLVPVSSLGRYRGLKLHGYKQSNASAFTYHAEKRDGQVEWIGLERRFDVQDSWKEAATLTYRQFDEQACRLVTQTRFATDNPLSRTVMVVDFS